MQPILTESPPPFPTRSETRLAAAIERLKTKDWTRLEGAPDTEAALQAFHGGGEVWYLSSGTAALEAILLGHGIGPGDEVITTPYTWGATVAAILAIGAVPVFADINEHDPNIDPACVEALVTPRTRAILAVHLFGFPADMAHLRQIAEARGLYLFEDGSQAHGARLGGQRVGRLGHAAAFSCMGLKPLAGTEGGYAIFEDAEAAERAYLHGKHPRGLRPERADALAAAGLLDSLQLGWRPCAIGAELVRSGLETLDAENTTRRENARHLRQLLEDIPGFSLIDPAPASEPVYHLQSIQVDRRIIDEPIPGLIGQLNPLGLGAFHYIPTPLHRLRRMNWEDYDGPPVFWHRQLREANRRYSETRCPRAEQRAQSSLEIGWNWTQPNPRAMEQIAQILRAYTGHKSTRKERN
ncbi:MAG: DegT/DnrJ/EryC1/StrS family aminotransferase [Opitutales bacterium]